MNAARYSHFQVFPYARVLRLVALGLLALPTILTGKFSETAWSLGLGVIVAVIITALTTLRTEVTGEHVRAGFRYGWPARTIALDSIVSHECVRNRWWYGLGIRLYPGGWLYAVWGLDAVEVCYDDPRRGRRRKFRIGTDDAEGLNSALTDALADTT